MEVADPEPFSLSITDDLDNFNYTYHPNNRQQEYMPAQERSSKEATCFPKTAADGSSQDVEDASFDLEVDYMPSDSDPPAYDTLVPNSSRGSQTANPLSRELRGPHSTTRQTRSMPAVGRQQHVPATTSSHTTHGGSRGETSQAKRSRTKPAPQTTDSSGSITEAGPPAMNVANRSDLRVDMGSSRSTRSKSSKKSATDSSIATSGESRSVRTNRRGSTSSKSSQGTVSMVKQPDGGYVTTNGTGTVSFHINGTSNVTICNNIDLRSTVTPAGKRQTKPKKVQRSIPAKGSKRRITPQDIEMLSNLLGDGWFDVGLSIGVDKGVLQNIKVKHHKDQQEMSRQMFNKWTHKYGHRATINYVIDALTDDKFNMDDIAEKLPAD